MKRASVLYRIGFVTSKYSHPLSQFHCFGPCRKSTLSSVGLNYTRQTVKEDKALVHQDWKECIKPLLASFDLNPDFFTIDEYFAAKSLVASRAFEIDEYHGFGMVPLADLFNNKTAAENVHFTFVSSTSDSDSDTENGKTDDSDKKEHNEPIALDFPLETEASSHSSSPLQQGPTYMEMIVVKDCKAGDEVFNTYGSLGNAALLHRYGFTELGNPFDILNIDLETVLEWSSSFLSSRSSRRRVSLWRKLGYCGCVSQNSEYFEVSFEGEPQVELLILLHIMLLPEKEFYELSVAEAVVAGIPGGFLPTIGSDESKRKLLLTQKVRKALVSLANARESLYDVKLLEEEERLLGECCVATHPKTYYSLVLRIGERRIIEKLRSFAGED
ncbi:uncharacterized protein LOC127259275 isoform X2 [Andrographis paniculata]|uniref:uncharacterized protein LOC127259275 isoform X2 n=1 Tax=Andrographis paniculata TaxID=175694 RepID=UPI0021E7677C|nr:uncharacterized protein LOC127259275 isoform X2 [Andrographis paniculata]